MPPMTASISVAALYCFTDFPDPAALREPLHDLCQVHGVRGTLLLAQEGINGTIAGHEVGIASALSHIRALPGCEALAVRRSTATSPPFHRLKVRVKREIVTMGEPIVARGTTGAYVAPDAWNALIADPDTILIDTRNDYEVRIGSFAGAIDPGTHSFAEFPTWFREHRERLFAGRKQPKVAMFCTGGIRCEKATALLKAEGVADVFHLRGGILNYLETVAPAESRWDGECFVFDERVAVGHGLAKGTHELCRGCRMPVSLADRTSPHYEPGVSCPACHDTRDATQRASYAERHRQVEIASRRGTTHVGERQDTADDP